MVGLHCCTQALFSSSGGYSSLRCAGFLFLWPLLLGSKGSESWSMGSVVVAHRLSCSVARGIFWTRDRTHVPCTGKQIPNRWTTRGVPLKVFIFQQPHGSFLYPWKNIQSCLWKAALTRSDGALDPSAGAGGRARVGVKSRSQMDVYLRPHACLADHAHCMWDPRMLPLRGTWSSTNNNESGVLVGIQLENVLLF